MLSYHSSQPQTIQAMFNSIAKRYDLANTILSFQLHKRWNRLLVKNVMKQETSHTLLDLCSGTGDIALNYLRHAPSSCRAILVDFSPNMLAYAKQKSEQRQLHQKHHLQFIEADVHQLPLEAETSDCATMAYGIRNVRDPLACMQEVYRVLKPGGCFGILELTRPRYTLLRMGHRLYLRFFLPLLGKWLADNQEAYHYLCNSIQTFIEPEKLEQLLKQAGFVQVSRRSLAGGVATLLMGQKPL